jgi:nonribosomal peptide synthetase CepC
MIPADRRSRVTAGKIAALIQEVLAIKQMAVDDNFFEVGGSSILALALIGKIKEEYGASLPLIDVIRNPTPSGLAQLVAESAVADTTTG